MIIKNKLTKYWADNIDTAWRPGEGKKRNLYMLAQYRKALQNFVTITTGKSNIPVTFSSRNSNTDGKQITISAGVNEDNFDVICGLALHEATHIELSDFNLVKRLSSEIPDSFIKKAHLKGFTDKIVFSRIKLLMNLVEDWRIDYHTFKNSPGYRGYYHALYEHFNNSKLITKALTSSEFRELNWKSYQFRIISITNKASSLNALPGLREIYELIDFKNISRIKSSRDALDLGLQIFDIILEHIEYVDHAKKQKEQEEITEEDFEKFIKALENGDIEVKSTKAEEDSKSAGAEGDSKSAGAEGDSIENADDFKKLAKSNKNKIEKMTKKLEAFLDGEVKKTNLSLKDANKLESIEKSDAEYRKAGFKNNKIDVLVIKNFSKDFIESNHSSVVTKHPSRSNIDAISKGVSLGKMLSKKLQIRNDQKTTLYSRKKSGKIDKRMLASLGYNNESVFQHSHVEEYSNAFLHLSIDASGSMSNAWSETMTMTTALAIAFEPIKNIDLVISFRYVDYSGGLSVPAVLIAYDSRKDKIQKVKTLFKHIRVNGSTPEGLCFESILKDMLPSTNNRNSYFLNISDGRPMYSTPKIQYVNGVAERHTREQINTMKKMGINILSYFIDNGWGNTSRVSESFKFMYGKNAEFININEIGQIAKTLNAMFLSK